MPRKYIRKLGARQYRNYTQETLEKAVDGCLKRKITIRAAADKYRISIGTIVSRIKMKRQGSDGSLKKPGRPTVFSQQEEELMCAHIVAMATFGFPVLVKDLKVIVKTYLVKLGRTVALFKNNTPGNDWVELFLKRHQDISHRIAKNITVSRASVTRPIIESFFQHLEKELEGVPPSNIFNFDETNFVDDPGNNKVLMKRGTKYPENIKNSTKACTTVMMCGNAAGQLLPPYVIYKAENVYNTWTEGGPLRCRYHRSKSGWIDAFIFNDWFQHHFLPEVRREPGKKVILGDNLSSHFSYEVLTQCQENNISFVALAPNATHLLQPLDVALFRPLKGEWRKVLDEWKKTVLGRRCGTIPKDQFPKLLKSVLDKLNEKIPDYLMAGFRKCGIYPCNPNIVLDRLCDSAIERETKYRAALSNSFIDHLKEIRCETVSKKQRKKKIQVPPGKGITAEDVVTVVAPAKPKKGNTRETTKTKGESKKKTNKILFQDSESSDSDVDIPYEESEDSLTMVFQSQSEDESQTNEINEKLQPTGEQPSTSSACSHQQQCQQQSVPTLEEKPISAGDFVVVIYQGRRYPGRVINQDDEDFEVTCMAKSGKWWIWPKIEDKLWFKRKTIVGRIRAPTLVTEGDSKFTVDMKQ